MKVFSGFIGMILLLLALAGAVSCIADFAAVKMLLTTDGTFEFSYRGKEVVIPSSRLVGVVWLSVPVVSAAGGVWLLRLGSTKKDDHDA